jgi:hypothetical protein
LPALYAWAAVEIPRRAAVFLAEAGAGRLQVGGISLEFPFTLVLTDVTIEAPEPSARIGISRVRVQPLWAAPRRKIVWLNRVVLERPRVMVRRTAQGAWIWPGPQPTAAPATPDAKVASSEAAARRWRVVIRQAQVADGEVVFTDERVEQRFEGALERVVASVGPIRWPVEADDMSAALQGRFAGHEGYGAPFYCSGWTVWASRQLDVSCRLEPLALAAFEPYYEGNIRVRVYHATLEATARLQAFDNTLDGRLQLLLGNLQEADISASGRTIVDFQKLSEASQQAMSAEVQVGGTLDSPRSWRWRMTPGNDAVQKLVNLLLERRWKELRIQVGDQVIPIELLTGTPAGMLRVQQGSRSVADSLRFLAPYRGIVEVPAPPVIPSEAAALAP